MLTGKARHPGCLPDLLRKNIYILSFLFLLIIRVFVFLRGIVIYKGCENEGRVTCWGKKKGFVIRVKAQQYVYKEKAIYIQYVCMRYLNKIHNTGVHSVEVLMILR